MSINSAVLQSVTEHIEAIRPTLKSTAITSGASLAADLGLDSMDLVELAARIADDHPNFDMNAWLFEASAPGMDSLGSLVGALEGQSDSRPDAKQV